jgi:hypothetical protein
MCVIPPTPKPPATAAVVTGNSGAGLNLTTLVSGDTNEAEDAAATITGETENSDDDDDSGSSGLLPDESWIAVICGVSKEQWNAENNNGEGGEGGLPEGFFVAPRDVYMPDLIAVGDVVLGKLVSLTSFFYPV